MLNLISNYYSPNPIRVLKLSIFIETQLWDVEQIDFTFMEGVPMGNNVPIMVRVYPMCSFQTPNILLPYILSDSSRVAPMSTTSILRFLSCEHG